MISLLFTFFLRKIFSEKTILAKIVLECISILLTLFVIYFASESFLVRNQESHSTSLFTFLLVGEIALLLPAYFSERLVTYFVEIKSNHFYQTLIGLGVSPMRYLLIKALAECLFPLIRIIFILLFSVYYLNFYVDFNSFFQFLILQFFSMIIYMSMALIAIVIYLQINRGINLFYTFQSIATILGGAYFSPEIFPNYLKELSSFLPQTQILYKARLIFGNQSILIEGYAMIAISMFVLLAISYFLYNTQIKWLKKKALYI